MNFLLFLLLLLMVMTSCENIELEIDSQSKSDTVQVNTVPLITDTNAPVYSLSGSCANNIDKVHVEVNGNNNILDCISNNWNITLDMTSEPNGTVLIVVSSELNSIVKTEKTINTYKNTDSAPLVSSISPSSFNEDTQSIVILSYSDVDSDSATACSVSSLSNVTVTQACACSSGVCTVGVTGSPNYNGAASFDYTITANSATSNSASASLTISSVDDAPTTTNFTHSAFNEDTQEIITIAYTDVDPDNATACSISTLSNITETQACACAAGVCTVGVTGTNNYNGAASFDFNVTANSVASNSSTASLNITNTNDAPVATPITPAAFNEDIESIITLSYTDADSDLASSCTLSTLTNITETQACACAAGVCTVGVTGTNNYNGSASFNYIVNANGQDSNSVAATLTINPVDDTPIASSISPASFNEDTQSIVILSYSDVDSDSATACSVSSLSNVTVTQACACSSGVCTVGVTGSPNYNGAASFDYTITANSATSNSASASLTISSVDDAPLANLSSIQRLLNIGLKRIITLSYTDAESDSATACSVSSLSNVTVSQACTCSSGVCTVGLTPSALGVGAFSYTVTTNSVVSNLQAISTYADEWVSVPVNAGGLGLPEFYVMKYEAKARRISDGLVRATGLSVNSSTYEPVSVPTNQPWRDINANSSALECESIGNSFHLISNAEWMAIARDIENQAINWTGGSIGTGCLFRGNSGDTTCGYNASTDPDSGTSRNSRAKHTLSNGQEVFDMSGNVFEWADWDPNTAGFQTAPDTSSCSSGQLSTLVCPQLTDVDYNTSNGSYTTAQGVGLFKSGGSGGAAYRGDDYFFNSTEAGIFRLGLNVPPTYAVSGIGFRCVYRP